MSGCGCINRGDGCIHDWRPGPFGPQVAAEAERAGADESPFPMPKMEKVEKTGGGSTGGFGL